MAAAFRLQGWFVPRRYNNRRGYLKWEENFKNIRRQERKGQFGGVARNQICWKWDRLLVNAGIRHKIAGTHKTKDRAHRNVRK